MSLSSLKNNNAITRLKARLISVDVKELMYEVLSENTNLIEDLNAEQLNKGLRFDNTKIEPEYSPGYADLKRKLGYDPNIVNLKLDGDYHKGITAKVSKYVVDIENVDPKDAKLSEKYGAEIIGLSSDSVAKLNAMLKPLLLIKVRQKLIRS